MKLPILRRLSNGLRAIFVPQEAESIAVGVFIASGARHESERTAGISHFIEHMLFKGTPTRRPIDITMAFEGCGGNFNAYTGEDTTCYWAHLPNEHIDEAIDIFSDMYLNSTIPTNEFEREKQVIIEEIKMYADEPDQVAMETMQRNLFNDSQLGSPVEGSVDSLQPMTPSILRRYIKEHYLPTNTVVVVVGKFDLESAYKTVNSRFGKFKRNIVGPIAMDNPFVKKPIATQTIHKSINQAQLALGYRTFGITDPYNYALVLLDAILGRGMSSRLFQSVREKRGLSYDISSRMQFFVDAGIFTISAGLDSAKTQTALRVIEKEIKRICEHKIPAKEIKRTKDFLIGNFRLSHEKITSQMLFYGQTALSFNRLVMPSEQIEAISNVSADELMAVANRIFKSTNRSICWVLPK